MDLVKIRQGLRKAMQRRIDANLAPVEGQWVTRAVLEDRRRMERRKARVCAVELLLFYLGCAVISLCILGFFSWLSY